MEMTRKQVHAALLQVGVKLTYDSDSREFRVTIKGHPRAEAIAYYTDDLEDAYHTGMNRARRNS
jgi:hypothetical protein